MTDLKTKPTPHSVDEFISGIEDQRRHADCLKVVGIMRKATNCEPRMWGASIVGFGKYHYRYDSGREGDWFLAAFSPRKSALTLYKMAGFERYDTLMAKLGKYKTAKSWPYVKRLSDVEMDVLESFVSDSVKYMRETHGDA